MENTNAAAAAVAIQIGVPTLLKGQPGTGKTSWVLALAEALGSPVETVIASIREPSDFAGLPIVHKGAVYLASPAWANRLADEGRGILFFDELSTAPPAVQAALLRVVLDRVVGDMELPDTVSIVAAMNPTETAAGGWDLAPALANRWLHLDWSLSAEIWREGMVSGWKTEAPIVVPTEWDKALPSARALIASFIYYRPGLLCRVPGTEGDEDGHGAVDASQAGGAWPSPRTWDQVSRLWCAAKAAQAPAAVRQALVCGSVGEGAGLEFLHWERDLDLADPEEVLRRPDDWKIPERGDQLHAVLTGLTAAIEQNCTKDRWLAGWRAARHAHEVHADIAAVGVKGLANMFMARTKTKAMVYPALRGATVRPEDAGPFVEVLKQAGLLRVNK